MQSIIINALISWCSGRSSNFTVFLDMTVCRIVRQVPAVAMEGDSDSLLGCDIL